MTKTAPHVVIIGAGVAGLAAAMRLAHGGARVTVLERHDAPGGKMRTLPTAAGPVDAGPTVLTMKPVFDALFSEVGERLADHVTMHAQDTLARHFWPDGARLDLMADHTVSRENVQTAFGARAAAEFTAFSEKARQLFDAFEGPMILSPAPTRASLTQRVMRNPKLIPAIAPHLNFEQSLHKQFSQPRLAQLFARYATYVGGLPGASPALLGLIWQAERMGVWHVKGGMHQLAQAMASCAQSLGATFHYNTHVTEIETNATGASAVHTHSGRIEADAILFNGDPGALVRGQLGGGVTRAVTHEGTAPRSLSAGVMSFAAIPNGVDLSAHNVFFADNPRSEYRPLASGRIQCDPTLYICAQDRFGGDMPTGPERFEIILNSPPLIDGSPNQDNPKQDSDEKVRAECQTLILDRLARFGLTFSPTPGPETVTTPSDFNTLFPGSAGSLYGRSPHGMMAAFKRPTARTAIRGLYLAGGGAHPGAGAPMATLSARHAAEAILKDLTLT